MAVLILVAASASCAAILGDDFTIEDKSSSSSSSTDNCATLECGACQTCVQAGACSGETDACSADAACSDLQSCVVDTANHPCGSDCYACYDQATIDLHSAYVSCVCGQCGACGC